MDDSEFKRYCDQQAQDCLRVAGETAEAAEAYPHIRARMRLLAVRFVELANGWARTPETAEQHEG